ncbi:hypothetical protein [Enterococcus raffinosus]|uniref:hypothetical protein n=1 Tax=Enterococcus raffinosus TaxID=71452 RepID=UPI001C96EEF2|nr:hypothetical protein [Enterococcus raffinosus]QZO07924.1 hypothetical protein K5P74_08485 [Enterococcus raffinosus]
MLNPFINPGLEIALKELFRDNVSTEQVHPAVATDIRKERVIVYVYPESIEFVFVELEQEVFDQGK